MKIGLAAALAASLLLVFSSGASAQMTLKGKHKEMNMQCDTCHGQTRPREMPCIFWGVRTTI